MAKQYYQYPGCYFVMISVAVVLVASPAKALTDQHDDAALWALYKTLNQAPKLKGWKLDGGDPCDSSWSGVSCFGSSVIDLDLHGLDLSGSITAALSNLHSLRQLDVSSNRIGGDLPRVLPPRATYSHVRLNMASNQISGNIPSSLAGMKNLLYLNLSHNLLDGQIGNVFNGLHSLRQLDLSYNNFTGDVRTAFGSLNNTELYLQNKHFTESVVQFPPSTDQSSIKSSSGRQTRMLLIFGSITGCVVAAAAAIACMATPQDANNNQPPREQPANIQYQTPVPPQTSALGGTYESSAGPKRFQVIKDGKVFDGPTPEEANRKADKKPERPPQVAIDTFIDKVENNDDDDD